MNILFRFENIAALLILFVPFTLFAQNEAASDNTGYNTYLDSLNLGKELTISIEKNIPVKQDKKVEQEVKSVNTVKRSVVPNGFRIQILASTQVDAVREKKEELEEQILLPLYISFNSPYYKLLAGNFTSRDKAEKALVSIKESGIPDAWIISSEVFVKE